AIELSRLPEIDSMSSVVSIAPSSRTSTAKGPNISNLDSYDPVRAQQARELLGFTGKGVIIGVIDTGIDVDHPDFKTASGQTRVLRLWDQTITTPYKSFRGVGTVYDSSEINRGECKSVDSQGHGTHVAGVAAGNGRGNSGELSIIGVAPGADLVVVKFHDLAQAGLEAEIINGISFIRETAQQLNKRYVVNLCAGTFTGPRDGTDFFETSLSRFLTDVTDTLLGGIVALAGNENYSETVADTLREDNDRMHTRKSGPSEFALEVATDEVSDQIDLCRVQIWYPKGDNFWASVISPSGHVTGPIAPDSVIDAVTPEGEVFVSNMTLSPSALSNLVEVLIYDPVDSLLAQVYPLHNGEWRIAMDSGSGTWDGYVVLHSPEDVIKAIREQDHSNEYKIRGGGNTGPVITVGAFNAYSPKDTVAYPLDSVSYFSSQGPSRNGLNKPDLYAPGDYVASAASSQVTNQELPFLDSQKRYVVMQGTSQAVPHVAGAIALLLEKRPDLRNWEVREILLQSARIVDGKHYLNVFQMLDLADTWPR
ncbi:MAG: S8 family serine peptidase, partial [bacterium]